MNYLDVAARMYVYSNFIALFILGIVIVLFALKIIKKQVLALIILAFIVLSMLSVLFTIKI